MPVQTQTAPNGQPTAIRAPGARPKPLPKWLPFSAAALIAAIAAFAFFATRPQTVNQFTVAQAVRGGLTQTVTASGTVNAQDTISVGTQVSGTIARLYADYNSKVRKGQVLAQIDPSQFQAQLEQARASLDQARAQAEAGSETAAGAAFGARSSGLAVESAKQDLVRARAASDLAERTLVRDRALLRDGFLARSQYDSDFSAAVSAAAALRAAASAVGQAESLSLQASAGAQQSRSSSAAAGAAAGAARAIVSQDELNLARTTIVSPVDGTVIARNVSVGQTVAASFQTPTLFTIARDLRKMEADISVGEPDIGNVRTGEVVNFTVLAYPNRTFQGTVSQVRENPTTIANVVTYTVVVLVANRDNALLPGMTANAAITVARIARALLVPIQALQYRPSAANRGARRTTAANSPWGQTGPDVPGAIVAGSRRTLFTLRDGKAVPVAVIVRLVNGTTAAVVPLGTLAEGDPVIVGDANASSRTQSAASNPAFGMGRVIR